MYWRSFHSDTLDHVTEKPKDATLYLPHDTNGCLSGSLGHTMLHKVKHVLIIQQANQVEGTEAGSTAQGQVPDYHGAVETRRNITRVLIPSKHVSYLSVAVFFCRPIEGPLEQELSGRPGEAGPVFIRLEHLSDHVLQPGCPLLQGALLL